MYTYQYSSRKLTDFCSQHIPASNSWKCHYYRWGRGLEDDDAWEAALSPIRDVMVFTSEHAKIAGGLISQTRSLGLSLGDRACLALAVALKAPVYTADKDWKKLKLGIRIHVIR
jgi:hypothetical protein